MNGTYDEESDAAYLRIVDEVGAGASKRQSVVSGNGLQEPTSAVFDFDEDGRLLGIEILGARQLLRPETLAALRRIG